MNIDDHDDIEVDGDTTEQAGLAPTLADHFPGAFFRRFVSNSPKVPDNCQSIYDSGISSIGQSFKSTDFETQGFDQVDCCTPCTLPAQVHRQEKNVHDLSSDVQKGFSSMRLEDRDEGIYSLPSGEHGELQQECIEPCQFSCSERITRDALEIYQQDDDGDTQLHMAIIQMLTDVVDYFISMAPHYDWLSIQNNLHQTALHLAVITRQRDIVRKLIVSGADVDPRDHKGNTPLHIACKEGFDEVVATLLDPVQYDELKDNAYEIPHQKIPQNLEDRNYEGQTCLHVAAEGTHLGVIRLLLSKGANINAQDGKSGRTVLHYAAETGNRILLRDLLNHPRIDVNAPTYGGLTAVTLAQGRRFNDIVTCLVQAGAVRPEENTDSDDDDDMSDGMYDDFCIGGEPIAFR